MSVLQEFQFELDGYAFGMGCPIFVDESGFDPGDPEVLNQDQVNPITGATVMGRDVRGSSEWAWTLHVDKDAVDSALLELGRMGAVWRGGAAGFADSRVYKALRYCIGGRTRLVYGRPRRFSAKPDNSILGGHLPPVASFQRVDDLHYDDNEQRVDMTMQTAEPTGLVFPISWPATFESSPDFVPAAAMVVGGDARTWPIVTFTGPVTNPSVTMGDVTIAMTGTIGEGGSVEIDTRPWMQTVKRVGNTAGASVSRVTRMARSALMPGAYSAAFRGVDVTGSARCQIRWRDAWTTL